MPLNAGKPNRSSSSGLAVGNHRHGGESQTWRGLEGRGGQLGGMGDVTGSEQMWLGDQDTQPTL